MARFKEVDDLLARIAGKPTDEDREAVNAAFSTSPVTRGEAARHAHDRRMFLMERLHELAHFRINPAKLHGPGKIRKRIAKMEGVERPHLKTSQLNRMAQAKLSDSNELRKRVAELERKVERLRRSAEDGGKEGA